MGRENEDVEKPFVAQLQSLGWVHIEGNTDTPVITGRSTFSEVVQEGVLRERLRAINLGPDGAPWLDDARLSEAVGAITRLGPHKLMEANEMATGLLVRGVTVEGLPDWDGGRSQTLRFIDWETPANNRFTVVNQYRVDCPPGFNSAKAFIVPDLVLLVNGIPLVVVECKSPSVPEPLADAVDQLRRYTNQRKAALEVDENEGNETLFHTNQMLIVTSFDHARVGSIGAKMEYFSPWKTVVSADGTGSETEVAASLGKATLSEQERLIAGLLAPAHLLDLVKTFQLFMEAGGQTVKSVCRYQQYRAVNRAVAKMKSGQTRRQHGEHDQRGGIIWHTQGSGKSLTMVFLVRKMRWDPALRRFKIVVITDRKDLQKQLSETAALTGQTVRIAQRTDDVKRLLGQPGPDLVFVTIQKYRDPDADDGEGDGDGGDDPPAQPAEQFEVFNDSEDILVLIDEAHRAQSGDLHATLMAALPNCVRIGFTGTPIIMGQRRRTYEIFGEYIDKYTIREAEADGATVPVLYEGRRAMGAIKDGGDLDELFDDLFREEPEEVREAIRAKYATRGALMDAPELIRAKARDMLQHYVAYILPNGYKAQVIGYSRLSALRYVEHLQEARDWLVGEAQALSPEDKVLDDEGLSLRPERIQAAVQGWRYLETLQKLEFAPIISGSNNDPPEWKPWTDGAGHDHKIKRFKKPLTHKDPTKADPLAFLVVKSMLLTGFDAPIEGVMYLDRSIREAELLQTIARVNRTGYGKQCGIVVDYFGLAENLRQAVAAYAADDQEDVEGALRSINDLLPILEDRYRRVLAVLGTNGIESTDDTEECVQLLADERIRADFSVKLKEFLGTLDTVLPRPEGLPYCRDAKKLAYIYARARNRYQDTPVLGKDVGAKVRKLIDEHVISLGIDPQIPPVSVTDGDFEESVQREEGERAQASHMEHAVRAHIRQHMDEDPELYRSFADRLNLLLRELGDQWTDLVAQLSDLVNDVRARRGGDTDTVGDVPAHVAPFLRSVLAFSGGTTDPQKLARLKDLSMDIVEFIVGELAMVPNMWAANRMADQESLASHLFARLQSTQPRLFTNPEADALVKQLMDLARSNHVALTGMSNGGS
jgi:type I restriction enzyme R subunit